MIIFTTIDFLLHRFSYTHTKKHLQRALKAPCRCLKRRTDTRAGRTAIALVQRLRPLLEYVCVCVCVCVCYTFIWIDQIKAVKSRNIFIFCLHFYTDTSYCFNDVHNEHRVQSYKVLLEVANNAAKNMHVPAFTRFEAALVCRRWLLSDLQSGNI